MGRLKVLVMHRFEERGAILVLSAMALVILMGMAAFAVDYGWLAYNRLEVRKAAEAAALAGVVHMPLPGSETWGAGAGAYDTAIDVAGRNGYVNGVDGASVSPTETLSPHQVKVSITDEVQTFFLQMFLGSRVTVSGDATAEQLPLLKLGSDESHLGGPGDQLWVAINGERRRKGSGDPYSTYCDFSTQECGVSSNSEHRSPAYYYAVEVGPGAAGLLDVSVYDGPQLDRGGIDVDTGEYSFNGGAGIDLNWTLTFNLYAPDSTPNTWTDNSTLVCTTTFGYDSPSAAINDWYSLGGCGGASNGTYVLAITVGGNEASVSAFALEATVGGSGSDVAVYGLGAMSLWMNEDNSTPTFKVVRLDDVYAGSEVEIGLFDPGDATGLAEMSFTGAFSGYDCLMQVTDENGVPLDGGAWHSDGWWNNALAGGAGDWAGSSCGITTSQSGNARIYNGDWIKLRFVIPPEHDCSNNGGNCWTTVFYDFDDSPFDRTTWTARVNGTPVHLKR
jgi:Flp pilus assembly protein TadG